MKIIAGVDIGNSTTEVCIGQIGDDGKLKFLSSSSRMTTGTKGTSENIVGIKIALKSAMDKIGRNVSDIDAIRINEAAPVIGDTAMETITETIITVSSMLGHNPDTPAGVGSAVGELVFIKNIESCLKEKSYIVIVPKGYDFEQIAELINGYASGFTISGLILQSDEAVLVENRLNKKIPIIDEVKAIMKIEEGRLAAIEVAQTGETIKMLSNPYGIATLLHLTADETKSIVPIAKSLIGKRSAVVIKTPFENTKQNILPAGEIFIESIDNIQSVSVDSGAEKIMESIENAGFITEIFAKQNTNIGNMFLNIKNSMAVLTGEITDSIKITDLLAVDTLAPVKIAGALAGETCLEKAVGVAAMVKTTKLPLERIAEDLMKDTNVFVKVAGVEAVMASLGALTTPGTKLPLTILDLGGGSTDGAVIYETGEVKSIHLAGAGELVTLLIQTELGLKDRLTAEQIKKYPLAKVESLFHIRLESGEIKFYNEPFEPKYFGSTVLIVDNGFVRINENIPMERIMQTRMDAKRKVFVKNAIRALRNISAGGKLRDIPNVVLVGGSAEDFEIPEMLTQELSNCNIVCGRGNIRKTEGGRNAVATGLVMSYL